MGLDFSHGDIKAGLWWNEFLRSLASEARLGYDARKRRFFGKGRGKSRDPILDLLNARFEDDGRAYVLDSGRVAARIRELVIGWGDRDSGCDGRKAFALHLAEALEEA